MAAAACAQMDMRFRQSQILEKGIRHVEIVVLSGMHNHRFQLTLFAQGMVEGGDLHKVGTGGGDQVDGSGHGFSSDYCQLCLMRFRIIDMSCYSVADDTRMPVVNPEGVESMTSWTGIVWAWVMVGATGIEPVTSAM